MADFIAVIRRAVDGLSENTPEMRAKVYERAKSAVVRQLENMKPRPPEVMFQRQIDKLDAAIREVEAEHAEAVVEEEVPAVAAAEEPTPVAAPEPVAMTKPEPVPVPEPVKVVVPEPVVAPPVHRELVPETILPPVVRPSLEEPAKLAPVIEPAAAPSVEVTLQTNTLPEPLVNAAQEPVVPPYLAEAAVAEPAGWLEPEAHPAQLEVKSYKAEPEDLRPVEPFVQPAQPSVVPPQDVYQPFASTEVEAKPVIAPPPAARPRPQPALIADSLIDELADLPPVKKPEPQKERDWSLDIDIDRAPTAAKAAPAVAEQKPTMPKVSYDETDVVAGFNDFLKEELNRQVVPPPPAAKAKKQDDFSWDAPFDDLPEIKKPEAFEKALEAKQKEIAADRQDAKPKPQKIEQPSARAELEDLLGIEPTQRRAPVQPVKDADALPPDVSRAVSKLEGKSFKMHTNKKNKKAKRGFPWVALVASLVGIFVLAGGAFAYWHYKDQVNQLVASLMPSDTAKKPETIKKNVKKPDVKSEAKTPVVKTVAKKDATQSKKPAKETEVASLDTGPQKFTQRLMPDGTEADTDAARVPVDQALKEGKSIAGQTEKGKEVADTTTTTTATDTKTTATDTSVPQNDAQPIGATQKMFLYEERLGQSSPVAVPGTVVWKEKADTDDGKPDPEIEAAIDIPARQISALITFKRNTDSSLPASHIIEIVFALPKNFEEGNVDSIQRVAFKQTEQDRGNPLIAVPAKITDDFHMVALNDDADARKVNLELMKTRSWIDIPITYRNGRRALITFEKGATGTAVFDKVMGEWEALGQQTSNNQ